MEILRSYALPPPHLKTGPHTFQSNILVGTDGHIRVAGLGAASTPFTTSSIDVDRLFYGAAPELVDPQLFQTTDDGATKASDMYAFSVLVWEVSAMRMCSSRWTVEIIIRSLPGEFRSPMRTGSQGFIRC